MSSADTFIEVSDDVIANIDDLERSVEVLRREVYGRKTPMGLKRTLVNNMDLMLKSARVVRAGLYRIRERDALSQLGRRIE